MAVLTLNKHCEDLTVSELKAIAHWKTRKADKAVPSGKPALKERYTNTIIRADRSHYLFLTETTQKCANFVGLLLVICFSNIFCAYSRFVQSND